MIGAVRELFMFNHILMIYHKLSYHLQLAFQRAVSMGLRRSIDSQKLPEVTLFISSFNTLNALQVTLGSLEKTTQKRERLVIADNASTDGSLEFLRSYSSKRSWVTLIESKELKLHGLWIDEMIRLCETKYLFFIDSDILFLGKDLISECVEYMERNKDCYLFSSERRDGGVIPTNCITIHEPSVATWFFGVRTSVREKINESFVIRYPHEQPEINGKKVVSDTGAKFIQAMKENRLGVHYFPWSLRVRFYHFGSLSWLYMVEGENRWTLMKKYQLLDLKRRAKGYQEIV